MPKSAEPDVLSKQEEQRLIAAGRRVLLSGGFPNPERVGCPHSDVLKAIASRRISLTEATQYINHVGSCSPCFIEYAKFQRDAQRRKTLQFVLASAALLILAAIGAWAWKAHLFHGIGGNVATNIPYQKITVDLRNRVVFRGEQAPSANSGPIQLPRARLDVMILLPKGSGPGNYGVQVSTELEKTLIATTGMAVNQNGITALNVKLDISSLSPGGYVLAIGGAGPGPREYPLVVK